MLKLVAAFALAATAAGSAKDVPEATPAGEAKSCISLSAIRESRVRDDRVIDFVMRGKPQVYRNTLPRACPRLGFDRSFSYATSLSQLCSSDIITVLDTGSRMRGASCGLGQFQPVTLTKTPKPATH